jgi:hypothetical protein
VLALGSQVATKGDERRTVSGRWSQKGLRNSSATRYAQHTERRKTFDGRVAFLFAFPLRVHVSRESTEERDGNYEDQFSPARYKLLKNSFANNFFSFFSVSSRHQHTRKIRGKERSSGILGCFSSHFCFCFFRSYQLHNFPEPGTRI